MSCKSCHQSINSGVCGCGTSQCKPYPVCVNSFHCPPPPPYPPCGYRVQCCGDGLEIREPVWHPVHPLIPMVIAVCSPLVAAVSGCGVSDEDVERELACALRSGEENTSTCGFPGDKYFRAVLLYAQAEQELRAEHALWISERHSALGQAFNITRKAPTLEEQPSWQLRERLQVKRFAVFSNARV